MMNLFKLKEVANKLQPELLKALEDTDTKSITLSELDRPIFEKKESDSECKESEARPLTQEEKDYYKDKLNCSESLLDSATVDENGKIYLRTINENKEGKTGEDGVTYKRIVFEVNGVEIEGVFPQFDSAIDVQLPEHLIQSKDSAQVAYTNKVLKEKISNDPEFAQQFSDEQLDQIENGDTPDGYTWHHHEESGKMQLIRTEDHQNNRHTGGKAIWGGGRENR